MGYEIKIKEKGTIQKKFKKRTLDEQETRDNKSDENKKE